MLWLCCESAACNGGLSASARSDAYAGSPSRPDPETEFVVRGRVSRELTVTVHDPIPGRDEARCRECGSVRRYGRTT